jgi:hypothetical protein
MSLIILKVAFIYALVYVCQLASTMFLAIIPIARIFKALELTIYVN